MLVKRLDSTKRVNEGTEWLWHCGRPHRVWYRGLGFDSDRVQDFFSSSTTLSVVCPMTGSSLRNNTTNFLSTNAQLWSTHSFNKKCFMIRVVTTCDNPTRVQRAGAWTWWYLGHWDFNPFQKQSGLPNKSSPRWGIYKNCRAIATLVKTSVSDRIDLYF